MIVTDKVDGKTYYLNFSGRFAFNDHATFKRIVKVIVDAKYREVILDFKELEFIDSAAIGMLLILNEEIKTVGGRMSIKNQAGQVKRVLTVVNIRDILIPS